MYVKLCAQQQYSTVSREFNICNKCYKITDQSSFNYSVKLISPKTLKISDHYFEYRKFQNPELSTRASWLVANSKNNLANNFFVFK